MDSTKMENSQWLAGIRHFFGRPFFSDPRTLLGLWLILGVVSALIKIHKCKNMENMFSKMQNQSLLGRCAAGVCLHSDEHVAIRSFPCFHPQELRAALRLEGIALRADMV